VAVGSGAAVLAIMGSQPTPKPKTISPKVINPRANQPHPLKPRERPDPRPRLAKTTMPTSNRLIDKAIYHGFQVNMRFSFPPSGGVEKVFTVDTLQTTVSELF